MVCRAVIFDYVGTLVNCRGYTMDASREKLHSALVAEGFAIDKDKFLEAYIFSHEKYRKIRYEQYREVTNAVWISEALYSLGFKASPDDLRIKAALNVFFKDFVDILELRKDAKKLLLQAQTLGKVGLISNFTYAPVIYRSLRKVGINHFFNAIVVSEENGYRKPCAEIFQSALAKLKIMPHEAVYIGDSPIEDIKGAKQAGLKTVFVPSQFNSLNDLKKNKIEPDYIATNLTVITEKLDEISSF